MRPNPTKNSRSPARLATRWTTRLAAAAVLAPVGLTLTATQAPAPVAAHLHQAAPAGPVVSGSWSRDDAVMAALKQASVSSPAEEASVLEVSPGVDLPAPALRAYRFAEAVMQRADPACRLDWSLLAAIGDVESDHGRYGGAHVRPDGTSMPHILGPRLDGGGEVAAISDTDGGDLDGDRRWDRAVGPMQFIPSTWSLVGADADGDGVRDPHDVDDAALAAAAYLCAGGADLSTTAGQEDAVYRYNHSSSYVDLVLRLAAAYADDGFALTAPQPTVRAASEPIEVPALERAVEVPAHPAQPAARSLGMRQPASGAVAVRHSRPAGAGQPSTPKAGVTGSSTRHATSDEGGSSTATGDEGGTSGATRDGGSDSGADSGGDGAGTGGSTSGGSTSGGSTSDDTAPSDGGTGDGTDSSSTAGSGDDGTTAASGDDGTTSGDGTDGTTSDDDTTDSGDSGDGDDASQQDSSDDTSGTLTRSDDGAWYVGETAVSFGDDEYLADEALHDFDGADGVESNLGELETLVGGTVSVVLDGSVVQRLNDLDYR